MKMLNLGCGTKVCSRPGVINIDWSIELRLRRSRLGRRLVSWFVHGPRRERFDAMSDNILVHNLAQGIPFEADSVDVVYHSHLFEHLDRDIAEPFLLEIKRVLKPGGVVRIVVPDLQRLCTEYLEHVARCGEDAAEVPNHDRYVAPIIEQCVRRESYGSSQQKPGLRFLENVILGDARRRGETHQWMYDEFNLSALLTRLGYQDLRRQTYPQSMVSDWLSYGLDTNDAGGEYKPGSLYLEARK